MIVGHAPRDSHLYGNGADRLLPEPDVFKYGLLGGRNVKAQDGEIQDEVVLLRHVDDALNHVAARVGPEQRPERLRFPATGYVQYNLVAPVVLLLDGVRHVLCDLHGVVQGSDELSDLDYFPESGFKHVLCLYFSVCGPVLCNDYNF